MIKGNNSQGITFDGESKWVTSADSRDDARLQRSLCDAVLVGAGTVIADDPELCAVDKFAGGNFGSDLRITGYLNFY